MKKEEKGRNISIIHVNVIVSAFSVCIMYSVFHEKESLRFAECVGTCTIFFPVSNNNTVRSHSQERADNRGIYSVWTRKGNLYETF